MEKRQVQYEGPRGRTRTLGTPAFSFPTAYPFAVFDGLIVDVDGVVLSGNVLAIHMIDTFPTSTPFDLHSWFIPRWVEPPNPLDSTIRVGVATAQACSTRSSVTLFWEPVRV